MQPGSNARLLSPKRVALDRRSILFTYIGLVPALGVLPVKHSIRSSAKAEAQYCRSLGAALAGTAERALMLDIARAFEELADVKIHYRGQRAIRRELT